MKVKVVGVYQRDLALHFKQTVADEGAAELAEGFCRWFFGSHGRNPGAFQGLSRSTGNAGVPADKLRYVPLALIPKNFPPRTDARIICKKNIGPRPKAPKCFTSGSPAMRRISLLSARWFSAPWKNIPNYKSPFSGKAFPGMFLTVRCCQTAT